MPPTNFTANILCRKHNSDLSPIDDAGLATFKAFRDAAAEQDARHRYLSSGLAPYRFPVLQHEVDGYNFERWLLKTLINMELAGDQALPIGRPEPNNERPPRDLVEIAYGKQDFQLPAGLYYLGRIGEELPLAERVKYTAWILESEGPYVSAGQFLFYGCSFVLNLDVTRHLPQTLQTDNGTLHALYRPLGFDIQLNNEPSQRIIFNW